MLLFSFDMILYDPITFNEKVRNLYHLLPYNLENVSKKSISGLHPNDLDLYRVTPE